MKEDGSGRIEKKSSRTAGYTCFSRAASYADTRECYSGPDNIAYILIPGFLKLIVKSSLLFRLFNRVYFPRGIYEYVIARTRYFDSAFTDALDSGFGQIVLFGAGFDSRALRFDGYNKGTRIFELDAPITQTEKLKAFRDKKLETPDSLVPVPIDFNRDSLEETTAASGLVPGEKTLFLLEGLTMYISSEAVNSTFRFISDIAGTGSVIVFDYIHAGVLRKENRLYGEKDIYKTVAGAGEEWTFALDKNQVGKFLARYGFSVADHSSTPELEKKYMTDSSGIPVGRINGTHAIVTGIRR